MKETKEELEARVKAYIANKSNVESIDEAVKLQIADVNSDYEINHRIGMLLGARYNAQLNDNETGRAETTTNYQPANNNILVEVVMDVTIQDIINSPTYAEILAACKGSVFITGQMNPRLKVIGYGHLVQGIEIGDYLDIKNVPGALSVRGIVAGGIDYEALHSYFVERNPVTSIAFNVAKGKSKVWMEQDPNMIDKDDVTAPFQIIMKGIIENHNIEGVYCSPNLFK